MNALSNLDLKEDISQAVVKLEKKNPTRSPATSELMKGIHKMYLLSYSSLFQLTCIFTGYWKLLYTDFDPPAESSGNRGERRVAMTRMRKTISKRLKEAQNTAAMLTTFNEVLSA